MKTLKIKPFQETLNASMCGPTLLKIAQDIFSETEFVDSGEFLLIHSEKVDRMSL